MRYEGKIIKWYDDKGFGFVRATKDSKDVFLHISEIQKLKKKPEINQLVNYEITKDSQGRFRAVNVSYMMGNRFNRNSEAPSTLSYPFIIIFLLFTALVIERTFSGHLPTFFPFLFIGSNLVIFLYYYQDKTSAIKKSWRTPESTLHFLSLLGGWGGAYIAQKLFRHKHKKSSFMVIYKLTVVINCMFIVLYSSSPLFNKLTTYIPSPL